MLTEANAFISIDVEDWYHLEYFKGSRLSHNVTCIDGLHTFIETLDRHQIKGNFFFLDEFALSNRELITELCYQGHGIGSHGSGHVRPVTLSVKDFYKSLQGSYSVLRSIVPSWKPIGYRAPCFALDDERLELVAKAGFSYDSSYIQFGQHPLYGRVSLESFTKISDGIYKRDGFYVFEVSTARFLNRRLPISGGGYLRLLPRMLFFSFVRAFIKAKHNYSFYIHPFELSSVVPDLADVNKIAKYRFLTGRATALAKTESLITMLRESNYIFSAFDDIIEP